MSRLLGLLLLHFCLFRQGQGSHPPTMRVTVGRFDIEQNTGATGDVTICSVAFSNCYNKCLQDPTCDVIIKQNGEIYLGSSSQITIQSITGATLHRLVRESNFTALAAQSGNGSSYQRPLPPKDQQEELFRSFFISPGCENNFECKSRLCALKTKKCADCLSDDNCGGLRKFCDIDFLGKCVGCRNDTDCPDELINVNKTVCSTTTRMCVGCNTDSDCSSFLPFCDLRYQDCLECGSNSYCPAEKPGCYNVTNKCVVCRNDADCPSYANSYGGTYTANSVYCIQERDMCSECRTTQDCQSTWKTIRMSNGTYVYPKVGICLQDQGLCTDCMSDDDCFASCLCSGDDCSLDPTTNVCVDCKTDADCALYKGTDQDSSGIRPACNTTLNKCTACSLDEHCRNLTGTSVNSLGTKNACDAPLNQCVVCLNNSHCEDLVGTSLNELGDKNTCKISGTTKSCTGCLEDADCIRQNGTGANPSGLQNICKVETEKCVECVYSSECPIGTTCKGNFCTDDIGCFYYTVTNKQTYSVNYDLTKHMCMESCQVLDYIYYAIKYGYHCYCLNPSVWGNFGSEKSPGLCSYTCRGSGEPYCGSSSYYNIYQVPNTTAVIP